MPDLPVNTLKISYPIVKGDAENFYPLFYKAFKYISKRSFILLDFEVANLVLSHLTGLATKESSDLEVNILKGTAHH